MAFERYYYSQPLPEGGRDNNTLEDLFSTVEDSWTPLVERIRADSVVPSDFEALCTFMGLMRVRVPAARDMVEASLAGHVRATAKFLDRHGKLPPRPAGFEDILDQMNVSIDPHQSLHAMPKLAAGFAVVIDALGFEVIHNKCDVSFLTTDNPVVYFDPTVPEARVLPYHVRPPRAPIELLFPVDAVTMLRGRTGGATLRHVTLTDRQEAKRINRFVARFGYRLVFARDRSHEALVVKHAATSPVVKSLIVTTPTGEALIVHEHAFGARTTKPKWRDSKPNGDI